MDTLALSVQPGTYPFTPSSYSRQMQVSSDGVSGFSNTGNAFSGSSFTQTGVTGKYLRVVETANGPGGQTATSVSPPVGPVAALVAVAALPLAVGAKVMGLGHSMISRAHSTQGGGASIVTLIRATKRGVLNWCKYFDQRFNADVIGDQNAPSWMTVANVNMYNMANQGVNGDCLSYQSPTTPGTLYRTAYALARNPDIVFLDIGTNDIFYLGKTLRQMQMDYDAQLNLLRAAGKWVLASTVYPRGDYLPGTPQDNVRLAFNTWLKGEVANRDNLKVADADTVIPTSFPNNYINTTDFVHLTDLGGEQVAKNLVLPILQTMVAAGTFYDTNPANANLFPSPGMLGTAGAKGAGVTGNVADNWSAFRNTGASTIVASKEVISGSFEKQVFTITPVADANANHIGTFRRTSSSTLAALGFAEGDWVRFMWYLELSAWDYWMAFDIFTQVDASGVSKMASWSSALGTAPEPKDALAFWAVGEPFQIPTGLSVNNFSFGTQSMLQYQWQGAAQGTGVVKVSQPILRKIADPRAAWNLP